MPIPPALRRIVLVGVFAITACSNGSDSDKPSGDANALTIVAAGETVTAITTGYDDVVLGPVVIDGVTYSLRVPALATDADVTLSMTPVTVTGGGLSVIGGLRFGPSGTQFRVPATLVAEGAPDKALIAGLAANDGSGITAAYAQRDGTTAKASIEHFSLAMIIDPAASEGASVLADVIIPKNTIDAATKLRGLLNGTVIPALAGAGGSVAAFAKAQRVLADYGVLVQEAGLTESIIGGGDDRTFGAAFETLVDQLASDCAELLEDLQKPVCFDGTGQLSQSREWFAAMAFAAESLRNLGGVMPTEFDPCLDLAFAPAVLSQGGDIPASQRFVQVFVAIDATSATGLTEPMLGAYDLDITGLAIPTLLRATPPSPALVPVDIDRGLTCADRSPTLTVALSGSLRALLGITNLRTEEVATTITFNAVGACEDEANDDAELTQRTGNLLTEGHADARGADDTGPANRSQTFNSNQDFTFTTGETLVPFVQLSQNTGDYSVPRDSGSLSATAESVTEDFTIVNGGLSAGVLAGRSSCSATWTRPEPLGNCLGSAAPCAHSFTVGRYQNDITFVLRKPHRFVASGAMKASGFGSRDASAFSNVTVRLPDGPSQRTVALSGGTADGSTRSDSFNHNALLQAGTYTLSVQSRSGCGNQHPLSPVSGSNTNPAQVSVEFSLTLEE